MERDSLPELMDMNILGCPSGRTLLKQEETSLLKMLAHLEFWSVKSLYCSF